MNANIRRHAYTNYDGKSYVDNVGVPYQSNILLGRPNVGTRTIIRTNEPNVTHNVRQIRSPQQHRSQRGCSSCDDDHSQINPNIGYDKNKSILSGAWSNQVRKDNLFKRYAAQGC